MATLFRGVPGAIENTCDLSSRLKFELNDLGYEFPLYPVPEGETMDSFLQKRVAEGIQRRYGPKNNPDLLDRTKKQVKHELALIAKLGFAGYFLIVWDIVEYCKRNNILIQGRGSAANSVVCRPASPLADRSNSVSYKDILKGLPDFPERRVIHSTHKLPWPSRPTFGLKSSDGSECLQMEAPYYRPVRIRVEDWPRFLRSSKLCCKE
jgi:DNA polymerase III alpha subunit